MIYCDYGALSTIDRKNVMEKIYQHLKSGGKFLLDVFSMVKYKYFVEKQTWENCHKGGFWSREEYIALNGFYKYSDNVTLEQITVISQNEVMPYHIWNTYFTKDTLTREAKDVGFKVCEVFSDVMGTPYSEKSLTIAILLEK